jgi:hypothetical protein
MGSRQNPPQPLPEILWGDRWRFASLVADNITEIFAERVIPVKSIPQELLPLNLGIASSTIVSGTIVYGGKQSMRLARWLEEQNPKSVTYAVAEIDTGGGLLLEADDRWILTTFDDREVAEAAKVYEARKKQNRGLHFFIVQPDDSGMTYSGFWLLRS